MKTILVTSEKMLSKLFLLCAVIFYTACATEEIEQSEVSDTTQTALKNYPKQGTRFPESGKTYYIENVGKGKFMDLENYGKNGKSNVHLWGFHGGDNQKWKMEDLGNGRWTYTSVANTNKRLEVYRGQNNNGVNIRVGDKASSNRQVFHLGGFYRDRSGRTIVSALTKKVVAGVARGRNIHTWEKVSLQSRYRNTQLWLFYDVANN